MNMLMLMHVNGFTPTNSYNIKFNPKNEFHGAGLCDAIHSPACSGADQPGPPCCCAVRLTATDAFKTGEGLQQLPLLVKDMKRGRAFTLALLLKCIVVNVNIFPTTRKKSPVLSRVAPDNLGH